MNKKTKYIIGGLVAIAFSWLFATLSVGSQIKDWYEFASILSGVSGIIIVIISLTTDFD